ncbi:MAG TPA: carboxypeptidase-like regulatory domain-containing protein, partial [Salinimicrobium sp.]|nr:carboxypeptidase-like regulatory domain-containing protein [Salinimicrobium sp.]
MNRILLLIILFSTTAINAQYKEKGSITGKVSDLTATEASLPFVNIIIKDSKKGTISDLNGNYTIEDLEPGTYTLVFSFIGYEKKVIPAVEVSAGEETKINAGLELSSTNLDQIVITTVARQDSETASLLKQKKAVVIKESIGAQELARAGVSDAEAATT